jgi:uncharacterized protein YcbK (DUF882 family)
MGRGRFPRTLALASLLFIAACARTAGGPEPMAAPSAPSADLSEAVAPAGPPRPDPSELEVAWAKELPPLNVECANTGAKAVIQLYAADGSVDPAAAVAFAGVAADSNGQFPLKERLLQLVVKSAQHFQAKTVTIVSGYRRPPRRKAPDHHAMGEALDFRLSGVDYRKLAAYLRTLPRVGVGVYTDPRTHYVHLDVRDRSFHWLDASPPGVVWREALLPDAKQAARDASYTAESDLPLDTP